MTLNVVDEVIRGIFWIPLVPEVESGEYLEQINVAVECYRVFRDQLN